LKTFTQHAAASSNIKEPEFSQFFGYQSKSLVHREKSWLGCHFADTQEEDGRTKLVRAAGSTHSSYRRHERKLSGDFSRQQSEKSAKSLCPLPNGSLLHPSRDGYHFTVAHTDGEAGLIADCMIAGMVLEDGFGIETESENDSDVENGSTTRTHAL